MTRSALGFFSFSLAVVISSACGLRQFSEALPGGPDPDSSDWERDPEDLPNAGEWSRPPLDPPGGQGKKGTGANEGGGEDQQGMGEDDGGWEGEGGDEPVPGDPSGGASGGWDEGGWDGDDGDSGGGSFVAFDVGSTTECDPWSQDCPEGEKCTVVSDGSGGFTNRCTPVLGDGENGESCSHDDWLRGVDDCNANNLCWSPSTPSSVCREFCQGSPDYPVCPKDFGCHFDGNGAIQVCLPLDDKNASSCPDADEREPQVRYMSNDDSNSQASPILARRLIREGKMVQGDKVRIYEFLNYYDFNHELPRESAAEVSMEMRRINKEAGEFALLVQARGRRVYDSERKPFNLVFSLDTSGSMEGEPLELLKDSMTALAGRLREGDRVSLVTWSDHQSVVIDGMGIRGNNDSRLIDAIEGLEADGSTNLHAGLTTAYDLAQKHRISNGINRVILISDGGANTGVTDKNLIAAAAEDGDQEGIYLVGVGVGDGLDYKDDLMDEVTDLGKGAHIFIDEPDEAERMFGLYFMSNVAIAARNVQTKVELPWYFGIKEFHGEEYSEDPEEVEPQHLAPNDSMNFHQIIQTCEAGIDELDDVITASVTYTDPADRREKTASHSMTLKQLANANAYWLRKSDTVVAYAQALIWISHYWDRGYYNEAQVLANNMANWIREGAQALEDDDLWEIADLMERYAANLR